jgi:hypothetical protein
MKTTEIQVFSGPELGRVIYDANVPTMSSVKIQIISASLFIEEPGENSRRSAKTYHLTVVFNRDIG